MDTPHWSGAHFNLVPSSNWPSVSKISYLFSVPVKAFSCCTRTQCLSINNIAARHCYYLLTLPGYDLEHCHSPHCSAPIFYKWPKGSVLKKSICNLSKFSYSTSLHQGPSDKQINRQGSSQRDGCMSLCLSKINEGFLWKYLSFCINEWKQYSYLNDRCFFYSNSRGLADHTVRIIAMLGIIPMTREKS